MVRTVAEDSSEQKVIDDIASYGWHCVNIMADDEGPEYSFTVGLHHSFNHPELIIFGLPSKVAHQIPAIAANAAQLFGILCERTPTCLPQRPPCLMSHFC